MYVRAVCARRPPERLPCDDTVVRATVTVHFLSKDCLNCESPTSISLFYIQSRAEWEESVFSTFPPAQPSLGEVLYSIGIRVLYT